MNDKINATLKEAFHYQQEDRLDKAQALFEDVLKQSPTQPDALHGMGLLYVQQRDFKKALPFFKQAVDAAPNIPAFHNNLGNCYKSLHQADLAIRHYRQALTLKTPYPEARNNLGALYLKQGLIVEAIEQLQKAVREDPEHVDAHFNLANALVKQDRLTDAVSHFKAVLKLRPDHYPASHNLGIALVALKDFASAKPLLESVVSRNPQEVDAQFHLGIVLASLGELEQARLVYEKTIELDPFHGDAYHNLATVCLHLKQPEQALKFYKKALSIYPNNQTAKHMCQALEGKTAEGGAPADYVRALFDQYAYSYDKHVTEALNYEAPYKLRQAIAPYAGKASGWHVLDLGCGTGLCAPYFRDLAFKLVGVDISPNMVEVAAAQKGYDQLVVQDISLFLEQSKDMYDLIIAADVFVYFGNLEPVFALVKKHLKPGGIFCFTVEKSTDKPYELLMSGRYAHQQAYIEQLAQANKMTPHAEQTTLRMQEDEPIAGILFVLIQEEA